MIHKKRVDTEKYLAIKNNKDTFELRPLDRIYRVGDSIIYQEFEGMEYTGREVRRRVASVVTDREGLKEGYVILSLETKIGRPRRGPGRPPRKKKENKNGL